MKTTGQKVIDTIIKGRLCHASCANEPEHNCIVVWSSGAVEQIDAVVKSDAATVKALVEAAEEILECYLLEKQMQGHPCPENMVRCVELRAAIDAAKGQP